jgi:RND family efflux transporter MFP subunit
VKPPQNEKGIRQRWKLDAMARRKPAHLKYMLPQAEKVFNLLLFFVTLRLHPFPDDLKFSTTSKLTMLMNIQHRRGENIGFLFLLGLILILAFFAGPFYPDPVFSQPSKTGGGPPPAPVEVAPVIEREVTTSVTLIGTGEAWLETVIASEEAGLVSSMMVEEGDRVRKGQPLCEQDSTQLELRIDAAGAELAEAQVLQAQADSDLDRQKRLFAINSVSEKAYEDAKFRAEAAQNRVRRLSASLNALEKQLKSRKIRAPITGYVVKRHCLVGQWLGEGQPVVTLVVPDPILFRVPVPERYVPLIKRGDAAQVRFDALPERPFQGKIAAVIPRADDASRTFPVRIEISNPDGLIKPGMLGRATLPTGELRKALLVPKDALVFTSSGTAVYAIVDQTAQFIPVRTGAEHGSRIEAEGDLKSGLEVVVRGNERLRPGQPVTITKTHP